jgi:hypothetical protein
MKFNRKFRLLIEIIENGETKTLEIKSPLTIQFQIERNSASSLNSASIRVYNLTENNRNAIFQNIYDIRNAQSRRKVILQAGYGDELSTIFIGGMNEAYSYRQSTEIITFINALDGGIEAYNSYINKTFEAGLTKENLFKELAKSLGLPIGTIGETQGESKRGVAVNGNTFTLLKKDFKDEFFIDLGTIHKLKPNEAIKGKVPLINSDTGLLGTPLLQGVYLQVDLIFEPRLKVGQLIQIESSFNKKFDGQYKIIGIRHNAIISEATSGEATTTLQLLLGDKLLGGLKQV